MRKLLDALKDLLDSLLPAPEPQHDAIPVPGARGRPPAPLTSPARRGPRAAAGGISPDRARHQPG
ncbi:MAG: hypothetical protein KatS3mg118_0792 [Paracoccaceae bacterium]|nr:MAG: hypothetical protein KatS3mg118_0792 [Paracoccaceae bacterium]